MIGSPISKARGPAQRRGTRGASAGRPTSDACDKGAASLTATHASDRLQRVRRLPPWVTLRACLATIVDLAPGGAGRSSFALLPVFLIERAFQILQELDRFFDAREIPQQLGRLELFEGRIQQRQARMRFSPDGSGMRRHGITHW